MKLRSEMVTADIESHPRCTVITVTAARVRWCTFNHDIAKSVIAPEKKKKSIDSAECVGLWLYFIERDFVSFPEKSHSRNDREGSKGEEDQRKFKKERANES